MKNFILVAISLLLIQFIELKADRTSVVDQKDATNPCLTDFDPNSTLITFYGDSLGDLIDSPLYGYFGWDWYLTTREPRVRWDIQNLAVSGNRTKNVALRQKITNELIARGVTTL